jgi:hypothetical protein
VAMQFCTECGKEVSNRAPTCPHCGSPVEGAPAPGPVKPEPVVVTVKKNSHPVLTVIGVIAIVVVVLIGGLILIAVLHKEPKFVATDNVTDTNCTTLSDYCINVTCTIQNQGDGPGTRTIRAQLLDKSSGAVRADHYSDLTLAPNESQRVIFSFPEAELDWQVSSICKVDPKTSSQ